MKKLFAFVLIAICAFYTSCDDNTTFTKEENSKQLSSKSIDSSPTDEQPVKIAIIHIGWDGKWGRTSKDCTGFGLCEAEICWFCCFDANHNRVPCSENDEYSARKSFKAEINLDTKLGTLLIPMSHDTAEEINAINEHSIFYIDEDIIQPEFKIHKGEYIFESTVGDFGGYKVNISIP